MQSMTYAQGLLLCKTGDPKQAAVLMVNQMEALQAAGTPYDRMAVLLASLGYACSANLALSSASTVTNSTLAAALLESDRPVTL